MEFIFLTPDMNDEEIQSHRKKCDCLMIDKKKLDSADSFIVTDESFDMALQPLRLVVIRLQDLGRDSSLLNDRFRRNTMIIASDEDVRSHPEIVRFLETQGVALLMAKTSEKGLLDLRGLVKSLTSLRFKSIFIEDKIDLIAEFSESVLV